MNEWGIPDWRDAAAYGDVKPWTINRWRWEFYRRRTDLREFFDRWADETHRENIGADSGRRPDEAGFRAYKGKGTGVTGLELLEYAGVPNPRIGDQPNGAIIPAFHLFRQARFYNPATRRPSNYREISVLGKIQYDQYTVDCH